MRDLSKYINIYLTPLQAVQFKPLLKLLADSTEAAALADNRILSALEDLQIDICANIDTQIAMQSDKVNTGEIEKEMTDYTRQYHYEQTVKARKN